MLDLDRSLRTSGFDGGDTRLDDAWVTELAGRSPAGRSFQVVAPYRAARVCLSVVAVPEDRDDIGSFKRAARRRAAFSHERSLPVIAAGQLPGLLYLGFAAGDAVQLASRLAAGPLRPLDSVAALAGVAKAVDAADRGGLTVWELTPRSVLIDDKGVGLIGDVGTGREAFGRPDPESDPHAAWLAPEVLDGEKPDARSSVYSLGTLLYASLTVAESRAGAQSRQGARRRARGRLRSRDAEPDIPPQLDEVIACALAPDPAERFESAGAFVEAARQALTTESAAESVDAKAAPKRKAEAAAEPEERRQRRAPRRRLGPALALSGLAVGVGVAVGQLAAPDPEPAPPPAPAIERASGAGVSATVPASWREVPAPPEAVAAEDALVRGPRRGASSALVAAVTPGRVDAGEEWGTAEPVRLGEFEALRYPAASLDSGARATLYLAPTSAGTLAITCVAGADAPARFLSTCERVASTARLASGRPLPLAERAELQARLAALGENLATRRAALRLRLAGAERRRGQAQAANALAGTYERTGERATSVSGTLADGLGRAARAYRRLSRAALNGDGPGFARARRGVGASEAAVARALRDAG